MTTPPVEQRWLHWPSTAELSTVVELVHSHSAVLVNGGHGRDSRSLASAGVFIKAWRELGGPMSP